MKALNEYKYLHEYIEDYQRELQKDEERIKNANITITEIKKPKSLLGHFIELLLAPFRR